MKSGANSPSTKFKHYEEWTDLRDVNEKTRTYFQLSVLKKYLYIVILVVFEGRIRLEVDKNLNTICEMFIAPAYSVP